MTLTPGASVAGYQIVATIGANAEASTFKAYQPELARYVVLRLLPAIPAGDAATRERVLREAAAVARLRHTNILAVLDYGEAQGFPYLVTELVEGGPLARRLGSPQPLEEAVRLLSPIAWALDYAHTRGVIHGGVKPSNILLTHEGTPLLADFGFSRLRAMLQGATQTGDALVATEYTAPELAMGQEPSPASDAYALAAILYEWLTGRPPFRGPTPLATLIAHTQQPVPPPHQFNSALGQAVDDVLVKGLAKRPEGRYATVGELLLALETAGQRAMTRSSAGRPPAAVASTIVGMATAPPQAPTRAPAGRSSRRALLAAPVAALAVLAGGAYVATRRPASGVNQTTTTGLAEQPSPTIAPTTAAAAQPPVPLATSNALPSPVSSATPVSVARPTSAPSVPSQPAPTAAPTAPPRRVVAVPPMVGPRFGHTATLLSDGKVLVAGGQDDQGPLAGAGLYDPAANQWSPAGTLAAARYGHTTTLLRDGKVLVAGGQASDHAILATAEVYDPAANRWSPAAPLSAPRSQHTAILLASGEVLVAGGWDGANAYRSSERFDPATGHWSGVGNMAAARRGHTATVLPDARVLVVGGLGSAGGDAAETFHPQTAAWSAAAAPASSRANHAALLLPNGQVLIAGGAADHGGALLTAAERYDGSDDRWSAAGNLGAGRTGHTVSLLAGGQVLVAAGRGEAGFLSLAGSYDAAANAWRPVAPLVTARWLHAATALRDGSLLVIGGQGASGALADVEVYDRAANTWLAVG